MDIHHIVGIFTKRLKSWHTYMNSSWRALISTKVANAAVIGKATAEVIFSALIVSQSLHWVMQMCSQ
ncbi:MAG: hypothetical protein B6D34_03230 [Candidatus Brocadia sp. UTAMX1]|nr:MAG: hypothetical protein B6D34_03230 [Candidatus Brocadia sp. UTAMX1]